MTYEEAKQEIPDFTAFSREICTSYCSNDWYCPSYCNLLDKAKQIDFDRILTIYAKHNGDMIKVIAYIKRTKIKLLEGGYGYGKAKSLR